MAGRRDGGRVGPVPRLRHRAADHRCRTRPGCWTPSTSPGSGSPPSTTSAAGCSRTTWATAAASDDPLYRIRRVLRRGHEHLTDTAWDRLLTGLDVGDVDGQVAAAWIAAQDLRLLLPRQDREPTPSGGCYRWLVHCADSDVPELHRLARTIDAWRDELLAYFDTGGISNGPTEAMNLLIKKIKRIGHGFRNFDNYRLRLLLHCGVDWHTQQPTRIRGRLPRLIDGESPGAVPGLSVVLLVVRRQGFEPRTQ